MPFRFGRLAVTHSFIPPTPGPVAVADIITAPLGWVILMGFILGIPTAVTGPLFGKYISKRIYLKSPDTSVDALPEFDPRIAPVPLYCLISVPLLLILLNTVSGWLLPRGLYPNRYLRIWWSLSATPGIDHCHAGCHLSPLYP